jgi:hypothetical protein
MKIGNVVLQKSEYKPKVTEGYYVISPQKAQELLTLNHDNNRAIKGGLVEMVNFQITQNNWHPEINSIKFYKGRVVDGQHRLKSIKNSGKTVICKVEFFYFYLIYFFFSCCCVYL